MNTKLSLFIALVMNVLLVRGQCEEIIHIDICDMTQIDNDGNGIFDGIINLFDQYTTQTGNSVTGTWFDPGFNFALDDSTGDLFLWDLDNSTTVLGNGSTSFYYFELFNASCGNLPAVIIELNLGAFSGFAVPASGVNQVNAQICDMDNDPCESIGTTYNLNLLLQSQPSAHLNGVWSYEGTSPAFISLSGSFAQIDLDYSPGPPLVDEEIFEFIHTVEGIAPCDAEMETRVRLSVVRGVFSGEGNFFNICETELLAGDFDGDIDLRDDEYLINEDIEGIWLFGNDPTGQLTNPGDSEVNIKEIYDDLVATTPKFGCAQYDFSYFVEDRSLICGNSTTTVSFKFFEYIRPFQQDISVNNEFCVDAAPNSINLYDYLEFTTENGVLFDYPDRACTDWELISGPSDLGLASNNGGLCSLLEPGDGEYTTLGTIDLTDLTNADAGTYIFEYTVLPDYNCSVGSNFEVIYTPPFGCESSIDPSNPCSLESAQITIIIHPVNYAGEDTQGLEFCESEIAGGQLNLIQLLDTIDFDGDGQPDIVYEGPFGEWTNLDTGTIITNPFVIPEINVQQIFNFQYNTSTVNGCLDSSLLTFTIFEQYDSGEDTLIDLCSNDTPIDLFTILGGTPDTNGTWTGPGGFTSQNNEAIVDPSTALAGDYVYTVPANGLCMGESATVTLSIIGPPNAGEDMTATFCNTTPTVDLLTLVDTNADAGGIFSDTSSTGVLNGSIVTLGSLTTGSYIFTYTVAGISPCNPDTSEITIVIEEPFDPGIGGAIELCSVDSPLDLFLLLTGDPDDNGTWTGPGGFISQDNQAVIDPSVVVAGDYLYTVPQNGLCLASSAIIAVSIVNAPNAGIDVTTVLCNTSSPIDLFTLLETTADTGGSFSDTSNSGALNGSVVTLMGLTAGSYTYTYTVDSISPCDADVSEITIVIEEPFNPGIGSSLIVCSTDSVFDLFLLLSNNPDTNGTWSGPAGYTTTSNQANFDPNQNVSGTYIYTVSVNGSCEAQSTSVDITVEQAPSAGGDITENVCQSDATIDLFTLLGNTASLTGTFIDVDNTGALQGSILDVTNLEGMYLFTYQVDSANSSCSTDISILTINVVVVDPPLVMDQSFCFDIGATVSDLQIETDESYEVFETEVATIPLTNNELLMNGQYFVQAIQDDGCRSSLVQINIEILSLNASSCDPCIGEVVSPNGDGMNDMLDLCGYPVLFPDYEIKIFNRYGVLVFEGDNNTSLFDGSSNVPGALGNDLSSGIYFYIFYPKDGVNKPFQNDLYLSR